MASSINHTIFFCLCALVANYMWWVMPPDGASRAVVWYLRIVIGLATLGGAIALALAGVEQ